MVLYQKIDDVNMVDQLKLADFEYQSSNKNDNKNQLSFSPAGSKPSLPELESFWASSVKANDIEIIAATFQERVIGLIAVKFNRSYSGQIIKIVGINDQEILSDLIKKAEIFLVSQRVFSVSVKTFNQPFFESLGYKINQFESSSKRRSRSFDSDLISLEKVLGTSLAVS